MKYTNEQLIKLYTDTKNECYFDELYRSNLPILKRAVSKFAELDKVIYSYDDYESIANMAFLNCVNKFDESRGFKFITMLERCIRNAIIKQLKKSKSSKNNGGDSKFKIVSIYDKIGDTAEATFSEILPYESKVFEPSDSSALEYKELQSKLEYIKTQLSERELDLLNKVLSGIEQHKIAETESVSRQSINARVMRLRNKIKNILEE